jgi:hypothetical protein
MASARLIQANQPIKAQQQPGVPAEYFGSQIAQQAEETASVFMRIQDAADTAESQRLVAQGKGAFDDTLATAHQQISDPEEFNQTIKSNLENTFKGITEQGSNNRVKTAVRNQLTLDYQNTQTKAKGVYFGKKKDQAVADLTATIDLEAKAAAGAPSDFSRMQSYERVGRMTGALKANGFIDARKQEDIIRDFDKNVLTRSAVAQLNTNPTSLLESIAAGSYDRLGPDETAKMSERARNAIEKDDAKADRNLKKLQDSTEQYWYTLMASPQGIPQTLIQEAKEGKNPYIKPQTAFEMEKKQEAGGSGGGGQAAQAIMSEYYMRGMPTEGSINKAQAEIQSVLRGLGGKPSPEIKKALNELQADRERTFYRGVALDNAASARGNADAQRQIATAARERQELDRQVHAKTVEYDANTQPTLKGLDSLFGNQDKLNKSKIEDALRKGKPDAAQQIIDAQKEKVKKRIDNRSPAEKDAAAALGR